MATRARGVAVRGGQMEAGPRASNATNFELARAAALEAFDSEEALSERAQAEIEGMLRDCGVEPQFADAEVIVHTENDELLGLRRDAQGVYQVVAKWRPQVADRLRVDVSKIEHKYRQRYAYLKVKKEAEKLGYQVAEEEILPDQSIRVRVRRWD